MANTDHSEFRVRPTPRIENPFAKAIADAYKQIARMQESRKESSDIFATIYDARIAGLTQQAESYSVPCQQYNAFNSAAMRLLHVSQDQITSKPPMISRKQAVSLARSAGHMVVRMLTLGNNTDGTTNLESLTTLLGAAAEGTNRIIPGATGEDNKAYSATVRYITDADGKTAGIELFHRQNVSGTDDASTQQIKAIEECNKRNEETNVATKYHVPTLGVGIYLHDDSTMRVVFLGKTDPKGEIVEIHPTTPLEGFLESLQTAIEHGTFTPDRHLGSRRLS